MNCEFQSQRNLWKNTLTFLALWNCQKCLFGKCWVNCRKIPTKMKAMYLTVCSCHVTCAFQSEFTLFHSCFSMVGDSKFKIFLYHEHFPETLEKYDRFPKFTLLFSIIYVRINGKVCGLVCCCFLSSLISFQQRVNMVTFFISYNIS